MCISLLTVPTTVDYHSGKLNNFRAGLCTKTQAASFSHIQYPDTHKLSRAFEKPVKGNSNKIQLIQLIQLKGEIEKGRFRTAISTSLDSVFSTALFCIAKTTGFHTPLSA